MKKGNPPMPRPKKRQITNRELNMVLAALRVLQANPQLFPEEFKALKPLAPRTIDKLCEGLNLGIIRV